MLLTDNHLLSGKVKTTATRGIVRSTLKALALIILASSVTTISTVPLYAETYGTVPLAGSVAGFINDYCTGCLFAYTPAPLSANGQTLTSWAFDTVATVDNNGVSGGNGVITPLLFDSSFNVIGIGTARTVGTGLINASFAFGLTAGTDVVSTNDYFGWADGSVAGGGNNGIIALTTTGGPGVTVYTCSNPGPPNGNAGQCVNTQIPIVTLGAQSNLSSWNFVADRTYEVNFTTTAVPEPSSVLFMSTMLLGAGFLAKKRFARGLDPSTRMKS